MPRASDDWLIKDVTPDRLKITNTRTHHETVLAKDHIHHYTSDLIRSPDGSDHGFLTLLVQIFIQGSTIKIRPCVRPGERLAPDPVVEVTDKWVDLMYPVFQIAQKLGFDPNSLAWCRESKIPTLVAQGLAEIVQEPESSGRVNRFRVRDSPESQMLIRRLPPR
jgi:hypothetical protein